MRSDPGLPIREELIARGIISSEAKGRFAGVCLSRHGILESVA